MPIVKELRWLIYTIALISAFAFFFSFPLIGAIAAALAILLAFIFRDLPRKPPALPLHCVSPVDGKVCGLGEKYDPYLQRPSTCVELCQSYLGEYNLHAPIEGQVEQLWVRSKADKPVDVLVFQIITDEKDQVVVEVDLASIFRHGSFRSQPGERIGHGRRCGFAFSGCRVNVYLPISVKVETAVGSSVKAGVDSLAMLVHK